MVLSGAVNMFNARNKAKTKDKYAMEQINVTISESQKRLDFMSSELDRLKAKVEKNGDSNSTPARSLKPKTPSISLKSKSGSGFFGKLLGNRNHKDKDNLPDGKIDSKQSLNNFGVSKADSFLTTEKVALKIAEISNKIELETKVKAGTENIIQVLSHLTLGHVCQKRSFNGREANHRRSNQETK
jgi:uncharacterized small protein (DUF1192 family)